MQAKTAKENINALPDMCYSVDRVHNQLIQIRVGETGFYPTDAETVKRLFGVQADQPDKLADRLNEQDGVTKAEREAMEMGSMFGWEVPGANVENYNDNGTRK